MSVAREPDRSQSQESEAEWERRLDAFEEAWQRGQRPAISDYLAAAPPDAPALLFRLVRIDLERRIKAGELVGVETYLGRYPALARDARMVLDLIAAEYRFRQRCHPEELLPEYLRRFPQFQAELEAELANPDRNPLETERRPRAADRPSPLPPPHGFRLAGALAGSSEVETFRLRGPKAMPPANQDAAPKAAEPGTPPAAAVLPVIQGYEILGELGHGGMGVVYQARDVRLNRVVALKMVLESRQAEAEDLVRFLNEAEAVARFQHPNIVQIHEVGNQDGRPYFTMEYVEGGTLAKKLNGTPLPHRAAAQLVEILARAMGAAHQQGIVHRDLKPANILLGVVSCQLSVVSEEASAASFLTTDNWQLTTVPKITDFGLAKRLREGPGMTQSGVILGTPSYMAPEQAGGHTHLIGPAADIYALGAILYETLTGRPPFRAATPLETVLQVLSQEVVLPRRLQAKLPRDLETICLKCLAKEPRKRYTSAQALAEDLRRFLAGQPIQARPSRPWERAWKWSRRRPALVALLMVSLLAGLGFAMGAVFHTIQLRQALGRAEGLERQTGQYLYASDMKIAHQFWNLGDVRQMRRLLDRHRPPSGTGPDRRGVEWYYLDRLCRGSEENTLHGHEGEVYAVAFAPDGQTLATAGQDGTIRLWQTISWQVEATWHAHPGGVRWAAFAPDGTLWSAGQDRILCHWNPAGGEEALSRFVLPAVPETGALALDGRRLALALDRSVQLWELPAGKPGVTIRYQKTDREDPRGYHIDAVAFARDGKTLAVTHDAWVDLWDAATGAERGHHKVAEKSVALRVAFSRHRDLLAYNNPVTGITLGPLPSPGAPWNLGASSSRPLPGPHTGGHRFPLGGLAFSPDDRLLAAGGGDGIVRLIDLAGERPGGVFKGHTDRIGCVAFSPNGQILVSASRDGTVKVWNPAARQDALAVSPRVRAAGPLAFSGDGKVLAVAARDRQVHLLDPHTGQGLGSVDPAEWEIAALDMSPTGTTLAVAGDRTIRLWDPTRRQKSTRLIVHPDRIRGLKFSRDGKTLAVAEDHRVVLWDPATGKECQAPLAVPGAPVTHLALAPNGGSLVVTTADRTLQVWDLASRKATVAHRLPGAILDLAYGPDGRTFAAIGEFGLWLFGAAGDKRREFGGSLCSLAYFPDGQSVIVGTRGGVISRWRLAPPTHIMYFSYSSDDVTALTIAPDGRTLAATLQPKGQVILCDLANWRILTPRDQLHEPVRSLGFTRDGRTLITGSQLRLLSGRSFLGRLRFGRTFIRDIQESVRCWDVGTGQAVSSPLREQTALPFGQTALSPDGNALAVGALDGTVGVWDLPTGRKRFTQYVARDAGFLAGQGQAILKTGWWGGDVGAYDFRNREILSLAFSADARFLAAASGDGEVQLMEAASGRELARLAGSPGRVWGLAFSPDGGCLATTYGNQVRLWEVPSGRLIRTLKGHREPVRSVAFSPDGTLLVSGAQDWRIKVWDPRTGQEKATLGGHMDAVAALVFSPDGQTLVSGSWDGTVRYWHVRTFQELLSLKAHTGKIHALAFSPDGTILASGGEGGHGGGEVFLWRAGAAQRIR